jgi:hypothetical protein
MKSKIDEAVSLFLREGDEIGEQDNPICQTPAPESNSEQLLFSETRQRGLRFRSSRASRSGVGCGRHREKSSTAADFITNPAGTMKIYLPMLHRASCQNGSI